MESFFHFLEVLIMAIAGLIGLFIILLALPKSKLRTIMLEILGWGGATVSTIGFFSPVDLIPDVIPVLGELDDIGYIVLGLLFALTAYYQRKKRLKEDK